MSQIEVSRLAPVTLLSLHPLPTHTLAQGITLVVSCSQRITPTLLALVTILEAKEAGETGVTLESTHTTLAAALATAITECTPRPHRVTITGCVRVEVGWNGMERGMVTYTGNIEY